MHCAPFLLTMQIIFASVSYRRVVADLRFKALQLGPVSKVAPVDKLSVAMAMLLAFFLLRETPDVKTIVGGLLIVAGSVVILF